MHSLFIISGKKRVSSGLEEMMAKHIKMQKIQQERMDYEREEGERTQERMFGLFKMLIDKK